MPHQFTTLAEHFKTKHHVFFFFFSQKREKTYVITLEVYNVKALEVYTLEVFIHALCDMLIVIQNLHPLD